MIKRFNLYIASAIIAMAMIVGMPQKARVNTSGHLVLAYNQANATGIPTIDIASLIQSLLDYVSQLSQYAEDLYQSATLANEYYQTLLKMEQIYKEYAHYLDQIEGLMAYFDGKAWDDIVAAVKWDYPINPMEWSKYDLDVYTQDGVIDVDNLVKDMYHRIRELDDVYADLAKVYEGKTALEEYQQKQAERQFERSRETTKQMYTAEVFNATNEALDTQLEDVKTLRDLNATGDQSDLRTMQTMAVQNELNLNYLQHQSNILTKMYEMSNQESISRKNLESYVYDQRLLDKVELYDADKVVATDRDYTADY